ncbi:MarR family winged helix-turn-helix transcriptional regulator [Gordonia rhizosphera]|uniref:Putative MarR family transcriptional regulator n=1 Tax=Gordonia rhizosphera NBRC 16068 TaxID=1108045 RepID=K6W2K3_9ACTN|nr:MarR family transcriptional regulator [Gordonia rhizosphera]GAB93385.1 putative MarR family transcriptional regulator [Gordonia rhizosphera NBRC 16068]
MTSESTAGEGRTGRPSFTDEMRRRTKARFPDQDYEATTAGIALTRAAQAHAVVSEKYIHGRDRRSWLSFRVLYVIWLFAPISARDLVNLLQVSRQTMSNMLKALESDGLINRTASTYDARLITLELTEAGSRSLETSLMRQFQLDERGFGVLSAPERAQLVEMLDRVRAEMARINNEGFDAPGKPAEASNNRDTA